jgi:hypothetical protein
VLREVSLNRYGNFPLLLNKGGLAVRFLGGICSPRCGSCGRPEPPRRDDDEALEALGPDPHTWQRAVAAQRTPAGCQDVSHQADGQDVGQRLGSEAPPGAVARQLGIHRTLRCRELREVQAVERRDRHPRQVEAERKGGDPRDQSLLQVDLEQVPAAART